MEEQHMMIILWLNTITGEVIPAKRYKKAWKYFKKDADKLGYELKKKDVRPYDWA